MARIGSGWQTVLADLSLILFMVTATAVGDSTQPAPPQAPAVLPALSQPVAVWRFRPGGPSLADWLAGQSADPRQRLTLVAAPEDGAAILAQARGLRLAPRILIEPGLLGPPYAALTFDKGETP